MEKPKEYEKPHIKSSNPKICSIPGWQLRVSSYPCCPCNTTCPSSETCGKGTCGGPGTACTRTPRGPGTRTHRSRSRGRTACAWSTQCGRRRSWRTAAWIAKSCANFLSIERRISISLFFDRCRYQWDFKVVLFEQYHMVRDAVVFWYASPSDLYQWENIRRGVKCINRWARLDYCLKESIIKLWAR